jgi:hypothetical protein
MTDLYTGLPNTIIINIKIVKYISKQYNEVIIRTYSIYYKHDKVTKVLKGRNEKKHVIVEGVSL